MNEAIYIVKMSLTHPKQLRIITLNPEMVVNAASSFEFQAAINNADLIVPDGTGIVWGLKLKGYKEIERIPGIELAEGVLDLANDLSKSVAIFGGREETLQRVTEVFKIKYPNIKLVKTIDGYQGESKEEKNANNIACENPNIVLVALGTPRQEIWINKYAKLFPQSLMIGIGGSLDIWSGKKNRAPMWARKNNLEWVYRVISEPKRAIRILKTLPKFVWMIISSLQTRQDF